MKTITSTEAKASLGDVFARLTQTGAVQVTTHGRVVAIITLPPQDSPSKKNVELLSAMALSYANGKTSWSEIKDTLDISYGELLDSLRIQGLKIPQFSAKKTAEQSALFKLAMTMNLSRDTQ